MQCCLFYLVAETAIQQASDEQIYNWAKTSEFFQKWVGLYMWCSVLESHQTRFSNSIALLVSVVL